MNPFEEDALYENFVCDMGRTNGVHPEIYDDWMKDARSTFAFKQGIKYAQDKFKEEREYLVKGIECEKQKVKTLKSYLVSNGFEVREFLNTIIIIKPDDLDDLDGYDD